MKEVTGELNITVIVAISIGILATFFFTVMWPAINNNYQRESQCRKATCNCKNAEQNDYMCDCWLYKDGQETEHFSCAWGG